MAYTSYGGDMKLKKSHWCTLLVCIIAISWALHYCRIGPITGSSNSGSTTGISVMGYGGNRKLGLQSGERISLSNALSRLAPLPSAANSLFVDASDGVTYYLTLPQAWPSGSLGNLELSNGSTVVLTHSFGLTNSPAKSKTKSPIAPSKNTISSTIP